MATFTVTQKQMDRNYSYALGRLLGQKAKGSGDPDNEFSIFTTANHDADGVFNGTYTVETPALTGRATRAEVQAVLDDSNPEQPPVVVERRDVLQDKIDDDSATLDDIREFLRSN